MYIFIDDVIAPSSPEIITSISWSPSISAIAKELSILCWNGWLNAGVKLPNPSFSYKIVTAPLIVPAAIL